MKRIQTAGRRAADFRLGYAILRFTMGFNLFVHGATRLPHLATFVAGTSREFAQTWLPHRAVELFAYAIAPIEVVLGLAIGLGLGSRVALPLASFYMVSLTFGTIVRADYTVVAEQLLYSLVLAILIAFRSFDGYSIDVRMAAETDMGADQSV